MKYVEIMEKQMEKQNNQLQNAKAYVKKGKILDARIDTVTGDVEVCIGKWENGSEWELFTSFENGIREHAYFNKYVSEKERGRLYKITQQLKSILYDSQWLEEWESNEINKINKVCVKYGYSLKNILDVLDSNFSYEDYPGHYFMPGTFEFMRFLFEEKIKRVI